VLSGDLPRKLESYNGNSSFFMFGLGKIIIPAAQLSGERRPSRNQLNRISKKRGSSRLFEERNREEEPPSFRGFLIVQKTTRHLSPAGRMPSSRKARKLENASVLLDGTICLLIAGLG
jgi:hypothetical protein